MGDWPIGGGQSDTETGGADTSTSLMTTLGTPAGAHTKGAYTELIAATAKEAIGILVAAQQAAAGLFLLDIAVGAAAAEVDVIANLQINRKSTATAADYYFFPLSIPEGSRVSARQQNGATTNLAVAVVLVYGTWTHAGAWSRCTTYGANTADSGGTEIDAGATPNTEGAWAEIEAASANPIESLVIAFGDQSNTARTAGGFLVDIGVGGSGSEAVLISDIPVASDAVLDTLTPLATPCIPISIPAGTRISARCRSSISDATDRKMDVILYGLG